MSQKKVVKTSIGQLSSLAKRRGKGIIVEIDWSDGSVARPGFHVTNITGLKKGAETLAREIEKYLGFNIDGTPGLDWEALDGFGGNLRSLINLKPNTQNIEIRKMYGLA